MKPVALLTLCVAALSACSPNAQLVTLRGNNVRPDPAGLVLDNDSLTLRYNFSSQRGQMSLSLLNKLDRPLYIDWKRSAFIVGQNKLGYWQDVAAVDLTNSAAGGRFALYSIGSINGTITKDEQIGFIPPRTRLEKKQFVVVPSGNLRMTGKPDVVQEESKRNPNQKKPTLINVYTYAADQSPLRFRNYLTLSTDKDFKTEFTIDTDFWASDIRVVPLEQLTGTAIQQPDGTYSYQQSFNKPDSFYIPIQTP
ncbi:hypothetical protein [Spirosoma utsteinense]|uniref:DUF4292 domain-containing protein n=1 Tax=Spirosoma utsteinense TaxID=2585773 RepID=A0ABR6W917_9BACT|nr:hypothetical protein [Spirosoma utsteinense]MBC3786121.1 hypothetical protein [Spirosoma utsteinense]MBC3792310.1 hypothetical protein [Spirosoma utsteinense]